ncbi:MAG TPA: hypothetical protein LFW20_01880, partial [Rickettsia endosymbiont of Omalisus fontisbellaquei]|nr:hypothetical protein [Rickettsia endosymbiont of Omalisus fontisbellaquei]
LKLTLSGDGKFKGVSLEGANIDINANNLILESVQDTISQKLRGANFHVGFDQEYDINGFGGGVESGYSKAAWTNQVARIIGSQVVNVTVKETLEIAGGLIANAEEDRDGNLTDKGNLSINCGRMIVKTLHDYDEGVTLGIGASFQVKASEKVGREGTREVNFDHAPLKLELKDKRREVSSVIGQGSINTGSISGDNLNRDITTQTTITRNEAGSFDSVIHADMFDRLTGNLPKRSVSVKRADTEAVRSYYDPDPSLVSSTGYYFSDIAENVKDAVKDLVTGGATAANFLGSKIDIKNLNTSMDKVFGGEQYMREFASKIAKSELEYASIVDQNLLVKLGGKKTDLNNKEELLEDTSELGIIALQKSLEDKIVEGAENKSSLQALLHILKDRYVKAGGKGDFNEFVKSAVAGVLAKNPQFAAKVAKDFEQAVNFAKQTVAGYIYKLALEKAQAEWQQEQAKKHQAAKQAKKEQIRKQQEHTESLEESIRGYEQYLRHNLPQTAQTTTTVEPNTESVCYAKAYMEAKKQETVLSLRRIDSPNEILISHINPEISLDNAEFTEYFIVIHRDLLINKDKLTGILEINSSQPGHTYIEFVTKKQILEKSFFGKYPTTNRFFSQGTVFDEHERYTNSKEYDREHNTNFLDSRIIPLTKKQFEAAYKYANHMDKNPDYFNIFSTNCNNFVQEVFAKTKIPGAYSQIYTAQELREMRNVGALNVLVNFGSCDKPAQVQEISKAKVMEKFNVPVDSIIDITQMDDLIPRFIVKPNNNCKK